MLMILQAAVRTHKKIVEAWYEDPDATIPPDAANEALWKVNESIRPGCTGDCCG
jgi:hypothetical protein